jgi:hypothetical protein
MKKKNKVQKKVVVNRKFLNDLADSIYNPKTRKFLRLCEGTLQNGPDPIDGHRTMHCGLGELHFAMTGMQPEETNATEGEVVSMAYDLSPLNGLDDILREDAVKEIKKTKLSAAVKEALLDQVAYLNDDELGVNDEPFLSALESIPDENDDGCGHDEACTPATFRKRSQRVAKKLREAASYLPK